MKASLLKLLQRLSSRFTPAVMNELDGLNRIRSEHIRSIQCHPRSIPVRWHPMEAVSILKWLSGPGWSAVWSSSSRRPRRKS